MDACAAGSLLSRSVSGIRRNWTLGCCARSARYGAAVSATACARARRCSTRTLSGCSRRSERRSTRQRPRPSREPRAESNTARVEPPCCPGRRSSSQRGRRECPQTITLQGEIASSVGRAPDANARRLPSQGREAGRFLSDARRRRPVHRTACGPHQLRTHQARTREAATNIQSARPRVGNPHEIRMT